MAGIEMAGTALDKITRGKVSLFKDARGALGVVDFSKEIPFTPVRMFWIHDVPTGGQRGAHAHKACTQFIICGQGQIEIDAFDGTRREEIKLSAGEYVNLVPGIFATLTFPQEHSTVTVLCDRPYEADDYIYDAEMLARGSIVADGRK
ncbi:FdtA/QdtA family cupin domain-containing protein [Rhizobium sp. J15]|uniref:sugar 3,4-ketoisomerase n=1 Tax=Rhizobium sp. J15 TaxID=2035450 RepID=UPI001596B253|nr:FdtA/QdtA family cupin domain-containing protein [Rhizobium sp. J15]